ncbi:FMN-dependent alpha-hydroxy acid dehydrogenase [Limtongia smithiae]|uniref:FMN-dependent alpha-hydroxy acid dehydrogenase n=1 Tax=Limtongia smithiae TaxID=1125753 RepID=UPI0034CEFA01
MQVDRLTHVSSWAQYQIDIYARLLPPALPTSFADWEARARARLGNRSFNYVHGSAGAGRTCCANVQAFDAYRLVPRMLTGGAPGERELGVSLFGKCYASPLLIAPVGVQSIVHRDAERATARAAAAMNVPFVLSTASSTNLEDVAAAHSMVAAAKATEYENSSNKVAPPDKWFQLYWPLDDNITASLLQRAEKAGFSVLVVTLDTFTLGYRPADLDESYLPFIWGEGCAIGLNDPVFDAMYRAQIASQPAPTMFDKIKLLLTRSRGSLSLLLALLFLHNRIFRALAWMNQAFSGTHKTWEDLSVLREHWRGPIVLKGVQSVTDVHTAIAHGVDGVIVSNHGGRQVDGAIASIDALAKIAADEKVKESGIRLLFDSGVRTGSDVVKALALGAHAVLIGRPCIYGLAMAGQRGVEHVLRCLLAEMEITMANIGLNRVADLSRDVLAMPRA